MNTENTEKVDHYTLVCTCNGKKAHKTFVTLINNIWKCNALTNNANSLASGRCHPHFEVFTCL